MTARGRLVGRIFINYRRGDSGTTPDLIERELRARFGKKRVFVDYRNIPAGADYAEELRNRLQECSVLLVVIGPRWLTMAGETGRRLDDPADWVRREIAMALQLGVRVIPVLLDSVRAPTTADLPGEIAGLSRCQGVVLRQGHTDNDLTQLVREIKTVIRKPRWRRPVDWVATRPHPHRRRELRGTRFWRCPACWTTAAVVTALAMAAAAIPITTTAMTSLLRQQRSSDPFSNERTVDPCALMDPNALRQFGETELIRHYGNFDRCDLHVDVGGEEPVDVEVNFSLVDLERDVAPGEFKTARYAQDSDRCGYKVLVSDEYDVLVITRTDNPTTDLCAIAEVATRRTVELLRQGPLDEREPFPPESLANFEACALLDPRALARLPGIDATDPDIGFGNWECAWRSTIDPTHLRIVFDQDLPLTAEDGSPVSLPGHDAFVKADSYDDDSCAVRVVHRNFSDERGQSRVEILVVVVSGEEPGDTYCAAAVELAREAAAKLS